MTTVDSAITPETAEFSETDYKTDSQFSLKQSQNVDKVLKQSYEIWAAAAANLYNQGWFLKLSSVSFSQVFNTFILLNTPSRLNTLWQLII